jgi:cell pole-organizing protein PopZ
MSDQSSQEPTMEEILASIRRIISEDDAPAADAPEAEPAEEPASAAPEPAPAAAAAEPEPEDEVLDLVDPLPAPPAETLGDLDVFTAPAPAAPEPEPEPVFTPAPAPKLAPASFAEPERLVGDNAAGAAASAFGSLAAAVAMPKEGRSLEDVTRELLRPLIKSWLDENLPRIVEAKVQEEVERIARQRG